MLFNLIFMLICCFKFISSYRILPVDKFNEILGWNWKVPGSCDSLEIDLKQLDIKTQMIISAPEDIKLLEERSELYHRVNLSLYGFADAVKIYRKHPKGETSLSSISLQLDSLIEIGDYYKALLFIYDGTRPGSLLDYLSNSLQFLSEEDSIISKKGILGYLADCKQLLKDLDTMMHPNSVINRVICEYLKFALSKYIEVMEKAQSQRNTQVLSLNNFGKGIVIDDRERVVMQKLSYIQSPLRTMIRDGPNSERSHKNILNFFNSNTNGSNDVIIEYDCHGGFQLIAGRDFFDGDIVLKEEPYVSFSNDLDGKRCFHCHRELKNHYESSLYCKCGAGYCSKNCKDIADYQYHNVLCGTKYRELEKNYIRSAQSTSGLNACLQIRLIARAISEKRLHPEAFPDPVTPLDLPEIKLLHRTLDRSEGSKDYVTEPVAVYPFIANQAALDEVFGYLSPDWYQSLAMNNFVPIVNSIMTNALSMPISSSDADNNNICIAINLKGSFFNHDCNPNVNWFADLPNSGRNVIFHARKPILKGEPLTISYLSDPLDIPIEIKQQYLKALYGFDCRCSSCMAQLAQKT